MDSVTQAVLGATVQGAILGRWQGRKALVYGAILGTLPDLDVVLDFGDAVANMTQHRGFSHSLFVLIPLAAMMTWVIRRYRPHPDYTSLRLFTCIALVLVTHVLLDVFTTYGTQIFWPLPVTPAAISSIFIIDPLYTLPLLIATIVGLIIGLGRRGMRLQYLALIVSTAYLASTLAGKSMADQKLEQALAQAGIQAEITFSAPTPFNTVLWRVVAVAGDHYYEGLVSWVDSEPPELVQLPRNASVARPALADSPQHERLRWFTRDILRYDLIDDQWVVTDLRLGMPGYHPFRFALAQRDDPAEGFVPISQTEYWPTPDRDYSLLTDLARRAFDPAEHIPIEAWASDMRPGPPWQIPVRKGTGTLR
ncbi:metal-dependent hydrolase [Pseudomonas sp.]|uniref:metal-dependent hydrolase n=1 Tax=Pseudomonas sp. TaxID=306 RepID=UPI00272B8BB7|nr:metal-dependent hydrolase [Pseudomonas sp.]